MGSSGRRRGARIVALVGVDGSGKSTQATLLATWLDQHGVPARAYGNPGGRMRLDRIARRLGRRDGRHLLGPVQVAIETAVRSLAIGRALVLARLTCRVAVMDRYTYCQYATIRARADRGERWVRAAFRPLPQPDLVCLLSVPPEVAHRRVQQRGTDREDLAYLAALDAAYRSLPEASRFQLVDARDDVAGVQAALRAAVLGDGGR